MSADRMREEFEAWAIGDCFARDRMPCGIYVDSSTEIAWRAWQAARVAPAVQRKPLGYVVLRKAELLRKGELWGISLLDQPEDGHTLPVYTALQPGEQQPDIQASIVCSRCKGKGRHITGPIDCTAILSDYQKLQDKCGVLVKDLELLLRRLEKMPRKLWLKEQLETILTTLTLEDEKDASI